MKIFDNPDFYPTPDDVARVMCGRVDIEGRIVLEPSMGKGDLVDVIKEFHPAKVVGCELSSELLDISAKKVDHVIGDNFLQLTADQVSHVQCIIANPPFSLGAAHVQHMWDIAPEGCQIVALLNEETVSNKYTRLRGKLGQIISDNGYYESLGECFSNAERRTNVVVAMVVLTKPIVSEDKFDMFFDMFDTDDESLGEGVMRYDEVLEIVNRFVGALRMFDDVKRAQDGMNDLIKPLMTTDHRVTFKAQDNKGHDITFDTFRTELQKSAWLTVFSRLGADKYMTASLKAFLNRFVEQQKNVPFTRRNIYKMIYLVQGTHGDRMQKVIVEVFDWLTEHTHENRYHNEGWKTNSEYIVNRRFIAPYCGVSKSYGGFPEIAWRDRGQRLDDLMKAVCYITGVKYTDEMEIGRFFSGHGEPVPYVVAADGSELEPGYRRMIDRHRWEDREGKKQETVRLLDYEFGDGDEDFVYKLSNSYNGGVIRYRQFGKWYDWGPFRVRVYKKGTLHAEFKNEKTWIMFNQTAAKAKGFQLASKFTGDYRKPKGQGLEVYK